MSLVGSFAEWERKRGKRRVDLWLSAQRVGDATWDTDGAPTI